MLITTLKKEKEKDQQAQEKCIAVFCKKGETLKSSKRSERRMYRHVSCRLKSSQPRPEVTFSPLLSLPSLHSKNKELHTSATYAQHFGTLAADTSVPCVSTACEVDVERYTFESQSFQNTLPPCRRNSPK